MSDRSREEHIRKTLERLKSVKNAVNQSYYDLSHPQEFKIHIRVDNSVPHGLFKPDPINKAGWIASEQTYRAMKKDIFALDENEVDELKDYYTCESCKTGLDRQFWHFCPYCTASFKN